MPFIIDDSVKLKNYWINGNFDQWQRGNNALPGNLYQCDRHYLINSTGTNGYCDRSTLVPNGSSLYSARWYITAGAVSQASLTAGAQFAVRYIVEGNDVRNIGPTGLVTLSFWTKTNTPGTYSVALADSAAAWSIVQNFTISSSNVWQKISLTFQLQNTSGTWFTDNRAGLQVYFGLASGTTGRTANLNVWQAGLFIQSTSSTNLMAANGNEFYLSQVQLNSGGVSAPFTVSGQDAQGELAKCQRYYETGTTWWNGYALAGNAFGMTVRFETPKRAAPAMTKSNFANATNCTSNVADNTTTYTFRHTLAITATGAAVASEDWTADAEF